MRARLTAVALLVGVAGCGGGGPERDARGIVGSWLDAMAVKDDARACALLTRRLQALVSQQLRGLGNGPAFTCRTYAAHWAFPPSPAGRRDARVDEVRLRGSSGTAQLSAPGGLETTITLRKEQGRWRIDNYQ